MIAAATRHSTMFIMRRMALSEAPISDWRVVVSLGPRGTEAQPHWQGFVSLFASTQARRWLSATNLNRLRPPPTRPSLAAKGNLRHAEDAEWT
jgi:hypothetical protein